jgi:hypothetical protein
MFNHRVNGCAKCIKHVFRTESKLPDVMARVQVADGPAHLRKLQQHEKASVRGIVDKIALTFFKGDFNATQREQG